MTGPLLLLALAMSLAFVAQFYPHASERRRPPVGVFLHGGYWFTSLTRRGQLLLGAGWLLSLLALFWAMSVLGLWRWQDGPV